LPRIRIASQCNRGSASPLKVHSNMGNSNMGFAKKAHPRSGSH
jgi:hypothetical protein